GLLRPPPRLRSRRRPPPPASLRARCRRSPFLSSTLFPAAPSPALWSVPARRAASRRDRQPCRSSRDRRWSRDEWCASCPLLRSIHHGAIGSNEPAGDRVGVVADAAHASLGDQRLARRLHVAGLVDRAAHDRCFAARPVPQMPEA